MPPPAGVTTFTLANTEEDVTFAPAAVGVRGTLTPVDASGSPVTIVHLASGVEIVPAGVVVTIAADGTWSIPGLPYTDQAGLSVVGFQYRMQWNTARARQYPQDKTFSVPSGTASPVLYSSVTPSPTVPTVLVPATSSLVTITQQSGLTYTLVLADAATDIELTNTQTESVTVPPNSSVAFPVGTTLAVRQMGTGYVNVVAGAGVTLRAPNGARTSTQYSTVYLLKRATNEWVVSGDTSTALAPPNAPTIGTATAAQQAAVVVFTPAASGPAATSYTATSTPGGFTATGSGSPITMPGLTAGTAYTFTVHATNTGGSSAESAASNSVTPTAPPAPSIPTTNMLAWFDASTISGVADGAAVASWLDVSPGAAHPLSQASSGNQPKLRSTSAVVALPNGKPVVDFDGFTEWMASTSHGLTSATFTVFWVSSAPTSGKTQCLCAFGSSDSVFVNTGNAWCMFCGTTLTSTALLNGAYHQNTAVYNGASSLMRRDGVQVASGNAGTTVPDTGFGYVMGANPGGTTGFFKGQIAEVIVYTGTLSGPDTTTVESYLKTKYATP